MVFFILPKLKPFFFLIQSFPAHLYLEVCILDISHPRQQTHSLSCAPKFISRHIFSDISHATPQTHNCNTTITVPNCSPWRQNDKWSELERLGPVFPYQDLSLSLLAHMIFCDIAIILNPPPQTQTFVS